MNERALEPWAHDHVFGQDARRPGESRTWIVIAITGAMMLVEVAAGLAFGSMALLADGLHMASHAAALTLNAFAYYYARRHAKDPRFNFGTGKINSLGGFAGAVLLVVIAFLMAWESLGRLLKPVAIGFDAAIGVAILGLLVNGACMLVLGHEHEDEDEHAHAHDHNLWSAYLHVLADALTSLLAILALAAGKRFGFVWLDPFMGLVGAALVTRWSWALLRATGRVLLDMRAPEALLEAVRAAVEREPGTRLADLHVWSVGPGIYAAELGIVADEPKEPEHYRSLLPARLGLVHVTAAVHRRAAAR